MAQRPKIYVLTGPNAGREFEVTTDCFRLGRSSSNDLKIADEELSRNHCLFEWDGESGLRVTDLASANGTFVNGVRLADAPYKLKEGDRILVGASELRVGEPPRPADQTVDLGLGTTPGVKTGAARARRSPFATVLWFFAVALAGVAIYLVLTTPQPVEKPAVDVEKGEPVLLEVAYEKVLADTNTIFRYHLTVSTEGLLTVRIDDVPKQNRHHVKSAKLSDEARAELSEILAFHNLRDLDREYVGAEPETPSLESYSLRVLFDTRGRSVRVVNTPEPEAFRTIREKLEAFSKSELGIWAIQYPREKLIELATQSVELGYAKWEDRDVKYGNLAEAIAAYKEALFYLETINPKPPCDETARAGLRRATEELDRRYADQRFLADRALNLAQWETARSELQILLEMVPDRRDDRNRDARAKLLSAEANLTKKGGR